jgi:hypothetical protein
MVHFTDAIEKHLESPKANAHTDEEKGSASHIEG